MGGSDRSTEGRPVGRAHLPGFNPAKLRALRTRHRLSARDLADLAGTSVRAVQNWESGRSAPDPRHARLLADALAVAVRDLTDLRDDELGLAELRALKGLVLSEMASRIGIDHTTLGNIEIGHRQPHPEQARKLGEQLGMDADAVLALWREVRARRLARLRATIDAAPEEPGL